MVDCFTELSLTSRKWQFVHKNISQGSIATHLRFDGIFGNRFTTNLLTGLPVKEFWKSVKIWQSYCYKFCVFFFVTWCIKTQKADQTMDLTLTHDTLDNVADLAIFVPETCSQLWHSSVGSKDAVAYKF